MDAPVFIKVEESQDIIDILDSAKAKLRNAKRLLLEVDEAKTAEENVFSEWRDKIGNVEVKINSVSDTLPEPRV